MSEYRLAEKPALNALTAMGYDALHHEAAMVMRQEANRILLKPVLIEALQALNEGLGAEDADAIYGDLNNVSDNEEWQRRLRGAYSRRLKGEARTSNFRQVIRPEPRNASAARASLPVRMLYRAM